MRPTAKRHLLTNLALSLMIVTACSGGGGGSGSTPPIGVSPPPPPPPPVTKPTLEEASRFLGAASFGATPAAVDTLVDQGYSDWIQAQLQLPVQSVLDRALPNLTPDNDGSEQHYAMQAWYENAIEGEDQLRQRAAYALSQFFVISTTSGSIAREGEGFARYMDILQEGAFGNHRDLLEEIAYSPMMGIYLTYIGNRKANPDTGAVPDENFAREVMQLFTIGLYELNIDGSLKLDAQGAPIETYANEDISGLAKVFTGLWWADLPFGRQNGQRTQAAQMARLVMTDDEHSDGDKVFLGETVPSSLTGDEAIEAALDVLFNHPNTAPFFSKQMIQRLTTSNPSAAYVERVAQTFERGTYTLPDGDSLGTGTRGDLAPVWAAILLDEEYQDSAARSDPNFGKLKEPVLRFTHWARLSNIIDVALINDGFVRNQQTSTRLGQKPFSSPSVFNFYRPGYSAPGSETAEAGLVGPELQITTSTSVISYANYMRSLIFRDEGAGNNSGPYGFVGQYETEIALADDADALVAHLDLMLTANTMSETTKSRLRTTINSVAIDVDDPNAALRNRVQLALLLAVASPEFLVQQ